MFHVERSEEGQVGWGMCDQIGYDTRRRLLRHSTWNKKPRIAHETGRGRHGALLAPESFRWNKTTWNSKRCTQCFTWNAAKWNVARRSKHTLRKIDKVLCYDVVTPTKQAFFCRQGENAATTAAWGPVLAIPTGRTRELPRCRGPRSTRSSAKRRHCPTRPTQGKC